MKPPPPVTHEDADRALETSAWERAGDSLVLERTFATFVESIKFVNAVAELAEAQDHHPDIDIRYNVVRLTVTTHQINGLSMRDLELARAVDTL